MKGKFETIRNNMISTYPDVGAGNMMRSPAITFRSKVFAFFHKDEMGFKLDHRSSDFMEQYPGSRFLSPFKHKPPMKGWLLVPGNYSGDWEFLALEAYKSLAEYKLS